MYCSVTASVLFALIISGCGNNTGANSDSTDDGTKIVESADLGSANEPAADPKSDLPPVEELDELDPIESTFKQLPTLIVSKPSYWEYDKITFYLAKDGKRIAPTDYRIEIKPKIDFELVESTNIMTASAEEGEYKISVYSDRQSIKPFATEVFKVAPVLPELHVDKEKPVQAETVTVSLSGDGIPELAEKSAITWSIFPSTVIYTNVEGKNAIQITSEVNYTVRATYLQEPRISYFVQVLPEYANRINIMLPDSIQTGECAGVTIESKAGDRVRPIAPEIAVSLEEIISRTDGHFYSDSACSSDEILAIEPGMENGGSVFFRSTSPKTSLVESVAIGDINLSINAFEVRAVPQVVAVSSEVDTTIAGSCISVSGVINDNFENAAVTETEYNFIINDGWLTNGKRNRYELYSNDTCSTNIGRQSITSGNRFQVWIKPTNAIRPRLIVYANTTENPESSGYVKGETSVTVQPDAVYRVSASGPSGIINADECHEVFVATEDRFGNPSPLGINDHIDVSTTLSLTSYSDNTCTQSTSSSINSGGLSEFKTWFKATKINSSTAREVRFRGVANGTNVTYSDIIEVLPQRPPVSISAEDVHAFPLNKCYRLGLKYLDADGDETLMFQGITWKFRPFTINNTNTFKFTTNENCTGVLLSGSTSFIEKTASSNPGVFILAQTPTTGRFSFRDAATNLTLIDKEVPIVRPPNTLTFTGGPFQVNNCVALTVSLYQDGTSASAFNDELIGFKLRHITGFYPTYAFYVNSDCTSRLISVGGPATGYTYGKLERGLSSKTWYIKMTGSLPYDVDGFTLSAISDLSFQDDGTFDTIGFTLRN